MKLGVKTACLSDLVTLEKLLNLRPGLQQNQIYFHSVSLTINGLSPLDIYNYHKSITVQFS